ncbi:glycoside hydrolase superfamily [Lipomyces tetrasporus]|uniref:beta-mannosidase n=1 Tax=Lipomyces tetrasporus TaxID=54092 RepID=A0AAD7VSN5_9ASCO|nr:glycoside hydrolase superfamily [Lipomyces tetrasporus]KAJ8100523.1 glycoside hydrolase superfamily [Lipomyces tetrasporus]
MSTADTTELVTDKWKQCSHSRATTQIHPDLIDAGLIADPFVDLNEQTVQWVGEADWEYQTTFTYSSGAKFTDLVFEGLDTFASVFINDVKILETQNMFHWHRIPVQNLLNDGDNTLRIYFFSALLRARELEESHKPMPLWNGESCRFYIRKAQYHFGWDWGPVLLTCGPYKEVKLETYDATITDLSVLFEISEALDVAYATETKIKLKEPELWYPHKYGPQPLYHFRVKSYTASDRELVELSKSVGLRRARVVQRPLVDQPGTSFYFEINNIPMFAAGSNWIPAHNFHTVLTKQDYYNWIKLAVDGNQDKLRVWGGGIYELDIFYQLCDRFGIFVWQDLMFECGLYPCTPELAKSVTIEAEQQVRRLRNYCSVVIYAGNNEDYKLAESLNIQWDPDRKDGVAESDFPGREYYEKIIPSASTSDSTVGDIHQWNVWHGTQEKYQNWSQIGGRFISEFGMLAFPNIETIKSCVTNICQQYPQSEVLDQHDKAFGFERRLALYVMENIKIDSLDLESRTYATQLMQAECLAYAYRCWRREWKGKGKEYIAGALVWQINDCWPTISWSVCDFYRRPKLAYYAIKRESAALTLGIYRNQTTEDGQHIKRLGAETGTAHVYGKQCFAVDVWGVNSSLLPVQGVLIVEFVEVLSGRKVFGSKQNPTQFLTDISVPADRHTAVIAEVTEDSVVAVSTNFLVKGVALHVPGTTFETFDDNGFDVFEGDNIIVKAAGNVVKGTAVTVEYYERKK